MLFPLSTIALSKIEAKQGQLTSIPFALWNPGNPGGEAVGWGR